MRIHPVGCRMLEIAGVDETAYAGRVERVLQFDSSRDGLDLGDGSLLRHTSAVGALDVAFSATLAGGVTFVSGPTPDAARIIVDGHIPETMAQHLVGRRAIDLVEHPVLMIDGLTISAVENRRDQSSGDHYAIAHLSPMEWRHLAGTRRRTGARIVRWLRDMVGV